MEFNFITILIATIASILVGLVTLLLYKLQKKRRYDETSNKALLESMRASFERQIYMLNNKLIQNEERWKDVNHLLYRNEYILNDSPLNTNGKIHYSEFLKANGIVQNDLIVDPNLIFILTPFHDMYYEDYEVIRGVCSDLGFKCFRGDENYFKGDIFPEMLKLIVKSNLIIANINGRNPNVLYELGIAQAIDKAVILISREPENIPIDIKSKKFLIYSKYEELQSRLREELINISPKG